MSRQTARVPLYVALAMTLVVATACGSHLSRGALAKANGALELQSAGARGGVLGGSGDATDQAAAADQGVAGGGSASGGSAGAAAGATGGGAKAGTSGGGAGSGSRAAGGATAGTKGEIVFGSVGTASGVLGAVSGPAPPAIKAWASWTNAHGGLAGHPVRVIVADSGGDPGKAQAIVRQFVEQDHVAAIFYDYMFTEKQAVLPYLEQKQVPLIGTIGGDTSGDHSPIDFNPLLGPDQGDAWSFLLGVHTIVPEKKKLASFYCREANTCSVQEQSFKKLLPWEGMQLVYEAQVSLAQPDYTSEVLQAKNAGAEVILTLVDSQSVIRIAQAAHRQGWNVQLAGTYNLAQNLILQGSKDLEGLILTQRTASYQTSARTQDYRDAMNQYQPGAATGDLGEGVFVVGKMLAKLAPQWPDKPGPADVIKSLYSLHGETLGGLLPGITFNQGEHVNVNLCMVPTILRNGSFVAHDAAESFVCAPVWKPGT
jgi:branched-chain amino acid transport system substrate-binding protein